jgi:hypothetical protein
MAGAEQKNHCTRGIRANITGVVLPRIPIDICGLRADMDSINKAQKTPASVPVIDMAALFFSYKYHKCINQWMPG